MTWWWYPLCTRQTRLIWYCLVLADWYNSPWVKMRSTQTHYLDSGPTCVCSYSLMLRPEQGYGKWQCYCLWFYPSEARNHDLPHSKWSSISVMMMKLAVIATNGNQMNWKKWKVLHLWNGRQCNFTKSSNTHYLLILIYDVCMEIVK
jgi:hypothetical protein